MRRLDDLHLEAPFDVAWDSWIDAAQRQVTGAEFRTLIYRYWPVRDRQEGLIRSANSLHSFAW